jgi:carbamoyltransferase
MQEMITWGISAGGHDAAVSVLKDGKILFAAHAERYSRVKNDPNLCWPLIRDAFTHGEPDTLVWHEKPWLLHSRALYAGQWAEAFGPGIRDHLRGNFLENTPIKTVSHHHSHAAGGYYTSGFRDAAIVVVDAIGEWDTLSIWEGRDHELYKRASVRYPNSLGLFYSAMTQRCGFKPNEEEYIMMGLAALGNPTRLSKQMVDEIIEITDHWPFFRCRLNLHRGCQWWRPEETNAADIAAAAQWIFAHVVRKICDGAADMIGSRNLVLSGGCALNCVTNSMLAYSNTWNNIWIMPNPGDAGNSLGAALAYHGEHIAWQGPYLGHNITGIYPVHRALAVLGMGQLVGVANGRAEFGPRALGNRSLFGDPRDPDIKHKMNVAKKREAFRPFAPVIIEELAGSYFDLVAQDHSYMQYVARCRQPKLYPGIVHVDGTSRVQTVNKTQHPGLWQLLVKWYEISDCPMLVNTSLNIKGQPLVNTESDAESFTAEYGIPVYCRD